MEMGGVESNFSSFLDRGSFDVLLRTRPERCQTRHRKALPSHANATPGTRDQLHSRLGQEKRAAQILQTNPDWNRYYPSCSWNVRLTGGVLNDLPFACCHSLHTILPLPSLSFATMPTSENMTMHGAHEVHPFFPLAEVHATFAVC